MVLRTLSSYTKSLGCLLEMHTCRNSTKIRRHKKKTESDHETEWDRKGAPSQTLWYDDSLCPAGSPKYLASTWFSADVPELAILGQNIIRPDPPPPPQGYTSQACLSLCVSGSSARRKSFMRTRLSPQPTEDMSPVDLVKILALLMKHIFNHHLKMRAQIKTVMQHFCLSAQQEIVQTELLLYTSLFVWKGKERKGQP